MQERPEIIRLSDKIKQHIYSEIVWLVPNVLRFSEQSFCCLALNNITKIVFIYLFICVRYRTSLTLHSLNVQMQFYCWPLRATVVYRENPNRAHNRTQMIDFWLCSGFSFDRVNINNINSRPLPHPSRFCKYVAHLFLACCWQS